MDDKLSDLAEQLPGLNKNQIIEVVNEMIATGRRASSIIADGREDRTSNEDALLLIQGIYTPGMPVGDFMSLAMKASQGKADPKFVREVWEKHDAG